MIKPDKALFYFDNEEDEGGDDSTLSVNEEEIDEGLTICYFISVVHRTPCYLLDY